MEAKILPDSVNELQQKIAHAEEVKRISNQIHAAKDLDQILLDMNREILALFEAEELILYAVDPDKKEIYGKLPHLDGVERSDFGSTSRALPDLRQNIYGPSIFKTQTQRPI